MTSLSKGKFCIAKPNEYSYSETFIDNQIAMLPHDVLISTGWYPHIVNNKETLLKGLFKNDYYRGILKRFFPNHFEKNYDKQLSDFLIENNIKKVLANYGPLGVHMLNACKMNGIELFVHFHGFDAAHTNTIQKFAKSYKTLFDYAQNIITVSNVMTGNLVALGADPNKIVNIPYGVNFNLFQVKTEWKTDKKIFFVGRFTAKKGPFQLVKAFDLILKSHPDAELHMIGDGEMFESTKAFIEELKLTDKIILHGKQSPVYIANALKDARLFMQHSMIAPNGDSEGTPNTILEASAMGLPIVSTRHAGIPEAVIDGTTGYLVDENDWQNMAKKAIELLDDLDLCIEMGKKAREHVMINYNLDKQIQKLNQLIQRKA